MFFNPIPVMDSGMATVEPTDVNDIEFVIVPSIETEEAVVVFQ